MNRIRTAALVLLIVPIANSPLAHAQDIGFDGTVSATCELLVTDGAFGLSSANRLDSEDAAGQAGTVQATTNDPLATLSITAPSAFTTAPPLYTSATTFEATMSTNGATVANDVQSLTLLPGETNAEVHLSAVADTGVFNPGDYSADVTVTCD